MPKLARSGGRYSLSARGIHACHVPRKSGVLTIEPCVIMAISTKHHAHPERLGTGTEQ